MNTPKIGNLITRTEQGERVIYRVVDVDPVKRTIKMEPVSVAGYTAIGLPAKMTVERRSEERRKP